MARSPKNTKYKEVVIDTSSMRFKIIKIVLAIAAILIASIIAIALFGFIAVIVIVGLIVIALIGVFAALDDAARNFSDKRAARKEAYNQEPNVKAMRDVRSDYNKKVWADDHDYEADGDDCHNYDSDGDTPW